MAIDKKIKEILERHTTEARLKAPQEDVIEGELIPKTSASELIPAEQLSLDFLEIVPSNEYMTAFTRIPVFLPVKNRKKCNADPEEGVVMETSWGRIRRFGAGLNIYDEDTLMGLMHCCRQRAITGKTSDVYTYTQPTSQNELIRNKHEPVITIHYGESSLYEINRYLNRGTGGKDYKKTRDSIRRLSRVTFEVEVGPSGKAIHINDLLFKLVNKEDSDSRQPFKVIFQPLVTQLLASQLTYIDMNIRMQLTDLGKAVHRFLSSQFDSKRYSYEIGTKKLYEIIGYQGEYKAFMRSMRNDVIPKLIDTGWIKDGKIESDGKNKPLKLKILK
ncbi:MAG: hypothetical protein QM500_05725 [Methylococcales bacterium]